MALFADRQALNQLTLSMSKSSANQTLSDPTLPFRVDMTERVLQFIWQFQYFNKSELRSSTGENIQIIFCGQYNTNQGPDFLDAKIKIGNETWAGNVELHVKASEWKKHGHDEDHNYSNVILHVVWENDIDHADMIPVLELRDRISKFLLERYSELMNAGGFIACDKSIHLVKDIVWKAWKERLLAERLIRKSASVETFLKESNYHWEEAFWWLLARNFGAQVNAEPFEAVAKSIPLSILAKHRNQIHQLEALLLGQAGLLNETFHEDYPKMLQKEYRFFRSKYGLKPIKGSVYFLRMRPGNFPTIRLAQLAMLVHESAHLFSKIKDATTASEVKKWFEITANDYWHYHYNLDESTSFRKKKLGADMIAVIIINTVAPMLFAYGSYHKEEGLKQKAIRWLEETSAEVNSLTKGFQRLGVENNTAFDSQALIELRNEYCNKKRCLDCAVGNAILKT